MGNYGQATSDIRKTEKRILEAKEAGEIKQAQNHVSVESNRYDEDFSQIYRDIEAATSTGAKKVYYDYISFHAADGLSQNTVNHVLKAAQQGDFSQFIFRYNKLEKETKKVQFYYRLKTLDSLEEVAGSYDAIETKIKKM